MRNASVILLALLVGLGAGFWLGRGQAGGRAQPGLEIGATAPSRVGATGTARADESVRPARDYDNETAIAKGTAGAAVAGASSLVSAESTGQLPPPPPRPLSPTENRLLGSRGLRSADMDNVLLNPHFGQVLDALSREETSDSLQMTHIYLDFLSKRMKADPRFHIERMACGAHVCVLSATGPATQDEQTFADFITTADQKDPGNPKFYAVMPASLPPQANATSTEYRLMFTIDPKFNSFDVSP
jgi:hypothetical protein